MTVRQSLPVADAMARILRRQASGDVDAAWADLKLLAEAYSGDAQALRRAGMLALRLGRVQAAARWLEEAAALAPGDAGLRDDLGAACRLIGRPHAAARHHRAAIELAPRHAIAHFRLASALTDMRRPREAVQATRRGLRLDPRAYKAHANMLRALHMISELDRRIIFDAHRAWSRYHAEPLAPQQYRHPSQDDPKRPLRLGLVSAGLFRHPVGYLSAPALDNLDPDTVRLVVYSDSLRRDDLTDRVRRAAVAWHQVEDLRDDELAARVRADGIDILIDATGHGANCRLRAFARRPAPVQVTWVGGLFDTTGLDAMDALLGDWTEVPPGDERWYSERVVRLPDGYVCYAPPAYAPQPGPLPALHNGHVTFGCFNNAAKLSEATLSLWAEVLKAVPGARLFLKTLGLDEPETAEALRATLAAHGITGDRLRLEGAAPHGELLAAYREVDIALDPFPYSGGLTTCEALWMGVPVLTLPGATFAGRHSASHLMNVGLGDWIALTRSDYVGLATRAAADVEGLARLRAGLRAHVAASPLCDGARFARNLEAALRALWERRCAGGHAA